MAASEKMTASQPICRRHKAPLGLYCVEMEELACQKCKEESVHKKYRFWTVQQAAQEHKVVLTLSRGSLLEKLEGHENSHRILSDMTKHLKIQAQQTEREIKDEFEKLHRFLQVEQAARIAVLRKEEEQKSQMLKDRIKSITMELSSITYTIKTIEQELEAEDISFLQNYKTTIDRTWCSMQGQQGQPGVLKFFNKFAELMKLPGQTHADTVKRIHEPHQEPELTTGALINMATHLGNLKYQVLEKMLRIVQHSPVTLDPNTAAPCLSLSQELTTMKFCTDNPQLPDNPERFTFGAEMLGSQSFTSGRHCWDVEVGENSNWAVGVARQSVLRKEDINQSQRMEILALRYMDGLYTTIIGPVSVRKKPQCVRVELDCDTRNVTFSDPACYGSIATMSFCFTEPVFPYFYSSCEEHPLKITPQEVRVSVELPMQEKNTFLSGLLDFLP